MSQINTKNAGEGTCSEFIPASYWGEDVPVDVDLIKNNYKSIQNDIAHYKIKIVAVTKYYGVRALEAAFDAGLRDFGESRAVDAIKKISMLRSEVRECSKFHFIGHLQMNKVAKVVRHFDVIHSVDSLRLAQEISKVACSLNKREKVLLQVNNACEEQKFGYSKDVLKEEFAEILNLQGVEVIGLMNMAPLGASESTLRELFQDIRCFRDDLEKEFSVALPELSMGMSNDYKIAIEEGATIIRIGRKLFK